MIAARQAAHQSVSGHQGRYEMREIVDALLYQGGTGCQWDLLPHDLPPRGAVMYYLTKWGRRDGRRIRAAACAAGVRGDGPGDRPTPSASHAALFLSWTREATTGGLDAGRHHG
ncbi:MULTISPECIES: transposase [Streptomyces]|uniref:transposase n=1 Tax=Streptomyces TaxID=1883 RepID=UPI0039BE8560